jgi:enoyl-CoA hydratase/carnithine racemase
LVGPSKALKILAGAPSLTANDCLSLGLADEIAGDGISALEKSSRLLESWSVGDGSGYAAAIRGMKKVVDGARTLSDVEDALRNEREVFGGLWGGPDNIEAIQRHSRKKSSKI